jgi:hypothetical protein
MSQNPVCHLPPKPAAQIPGPKNIPGLPGAVSPPTSNSPGAQQQFNNEIAGIINQILQMLKMLGNQLNTNSNSSGQKPPKPQWNEVSRVTEKVRVFQNNDHTSPNWVDVEQINALVFSDKNTGAQWKWSR